MVTPQGWNAHFSSQSRGNSIEDIGHPLKSEGCSIEHITGKDLTSQLKALINSAQTPK
jgi:hypothetical protein